ncbi:MAG: zinc ribbon domain-containing protein [Bacteroidales bacterium]|nr:zinc ribbon domain-containing protein [Bacteroidales bacterium]
MNYCPNCSAPIDENESVCSQCGTSLNAPVCTEKAIVEEQVPRRKGPWNAFARVGNILGTISIITCWIPIVCISAWMTGPVGIALGAMGLRADAPGMSAKARKGMVKSIIGTVVSFIVYFAFIVLLSLEHEF